MFFNLKYPLDVVPVPGRFPKQTDAAIDIATYRLNQPRGWCSENPNQKLNKYKWTKYCNKIKFKKIGHPKLETEILVCHSFFGSCVTLRGPPLNSETRWTVKNIVSFLCTNPISFACLVNLLNCALNTIG